MLSADCGEGEMERLDVEVYTNTDSTNTEDQPIAHRHGHNVTDTHRRMVPRESHYYTTDYGHSTLKTEHSPPTQRQHWRDRPLPSPPVLSLRFPHPARLSARHMNQ
ncbi:hypothetical protein J6590_041862 [Homalodisca vitripennis]|nr:hypothetical protein J6590_041862 [Homalodisca vitripennis]